MQSDPNVYGVDVAKDELFTGALGRNTVQRVANKEDAVRAWLRQLPKGSVVAMESTGRYHLLLARLAHQAGMRVYVLNARNVRRYAEGLGVRGKTDRLDTDVIARYVAEHQNKLHQWLPEVSQLSTVEELIRRRTVVVAKRESLRQCMGHCPQLRDAWQQLDRAFATLVHCIEAKVKAAIKADDKLRAGQKNIQTVIGFGPLGSSLLAGLLERIPFARSDSLVAYTGWDPQPADSGRRRGRRQLTKAGPAYLRKQWYMVGLTAARSRALKPTYEALRAKGLTSTEAIIILARKLLRVAYAVWKSGRPFDLNKLIGSPQAG